MQLQSACVVALTIRVYADLDLECLRPLTNIFDYPLEYTSPDYTANPPIPLAIDPDSPALAYIGSMDVVDGWWSDHALPNAFMASIPRHPLWLVTLTGVLHNTEGDLANKGENFAAEVTTGPVALLRAVKAYRENLAASGDLHDVVDARLREMTGPAGQSHNLVVFDTGVIYPFSWVLDFANENAHQQSPTTVERVSLKHCLAQKGQHFDPIRCLGMSMSAGIAVPARVVQC